ncbi:MAG: GAF domain-containing sensor histidine kinase [Oscillatoria sp. PMC 1068.18]|nr:GAF domain-containing sensor histidine kinase [Oscillatoria sp. PMC 1076.18]MEC4988792.1 GAF domain-containing sensor histidine kinase [Oscillatoria sp. PMC 1068.18]
MQVAEVRLGASMVNQNHKLFCRLDDLTPTAREKQRLAVLRNLGLLEAETPPVFEEAIQTAANHLEAQICFLGLMVEEVVWLKSTVGLSSIGLMNQLATSRQLPRHESFCSYVVDSQNYLAIADATLDPVFAQTILFQHYGIRAYLGVPLLTAEGICLGTLAVMDAVPRQFTPRDVEFLTITARWCLSEHERNRYLRANSLPPSLLTTTENSPFLPSTKVGESISPNQSIYSQSNQLTWDSRASFTANSTNQIKAKLLMQLAQELKTPLTSVMGMTSVLEREVYGALTNKQKEYLGVIHNSGEQLLSLVEEIVNLEIAKEDSQQLQLHSVDIEMLCQQAVNNLEKIAKIRQQQIHLSVEPGNRIWLLDKNKVRQALHYLIASTIASAETGSEVRIHVSRKINKLNIAVWVSHPWLGEGLPESEIYATILGNETLHPSVINEFVSVGVKTGNRSTLSSASLYSALLEAEQVQDKSTTDKSREILGLLLCCHLTEMHGGVVFVQGSQDNGYRYIINLPQMLPAEA